MKSRISICITAMTLLTVAIPVRLAAQDHQDSQNARFITFDAPGAGTGAFQGTLPQDNNPPGATTGYYFDSGQAPHGFLRARDATITTFDVPGSGRGPYQGTGAISVTPAGVITGFYQDSSNVTHGFLRARDGTFTTFDAPGAGTSPGQGTWAWNINPVGDRGRLP